MTYPIKDLISILTDECVGKKKKIKTIRKALKSEDFLTFIYVEKDPQRKNQLYEFFSNVSNLKLLLAAIDIDSDYDGDGFFDAFSRCIEKPDLPRSAATFLYTICEYVSDKCSLATSTADKDYEAGLISASMRNEIYENSDRKFSYIKSRNNVAIDDITSDLVKKIATKTSRSSGVPFEVCSRAFKIVPNKKYIRKDMIGFYMAQLTDAIYEEIDNVDELSVIDWDDFFIPLFGVENIIDVAMYLTLESSVKLSGRRHEHRIRIIWDSLSVYALTVLNGADDNTLQHMIDLYSKIVSSMNSVDRKDLRVDLREIGSEFGNLARAVRKSIDKIEEAIAIKNCEASAVSAL